LPTPPADLAIKGRPVLSRSRRPPALTGLPDCELSSRIHCVKRKGTALARLSLTE